MDFKAGDVVRVIKRINTDSCTWIDEMDVYVNDGKDYVVFSPTDGEGDTYVNMADGEYYYFPRGSIEPVTESAKHQTRVENLLDKINASYIYNGFSFQTVTGLRAELVSVAYRNFVGCANNTVGIDNLIEELKAVKEVCLKLK